VLRLTEATWFRRLVTGRLGRPLVARFVAGEHLDDAIRVAKGLDGQKISTILDHLGENVTAPEHATEAVAAYVRALDRIRLEPFLDLTISVKLTQLGLDFSHELCVANMERVLEAAADLLSPAWERVEGGGSGGGGRRGGREIRGASGVAALQPAPVNKGREQLPPVDAAVSVDVEARHELLDLRSSENSS